MGFGRKMAYVRSESVLGFAGWSGEAALVEPVRALAGGLRRFGERESIRLLACRFHALTGIVSVEHGHDSALNIAVFVD